MRMAKLQQHLRDAGQRKAGLDLGADRWYLQRLGVQACENPAACRAQQQPVQGLAGVQPVGRAVGGGDQDRCRRWRRSAAVEQAEVAVEVEVTLSKPPGQGPAPPGESMRRNAV